MKKILVIDDEEWLREMIHLALSQKGYEVVEAANGEEGIAQARKEGRRHGRPRTASLKADEVLGLKAERLSQTEIARRLGIGRTSVRRIVAEGR